ncbi:MAG TPA: hypothetical protein VFZ73_12120 [Gemmatimonadaceae bacterium]
MYTPIAHGVTGAHPRGLSAEQVVSHSLALGIVALSVATAQRHVLNRYVSVPWTRLPLAVIGFVAAFWGGFYQPWVGGPDFDILFGSLVLGSAVFVGVVPTQGHRLAFIIALLGFPIGCFLGQLMILTIVVALGVVPNVQGSDLQHSVYWISVGVSMGTIGGGIGGLALRRMLLTTSRTVPF